MHPFHSLLVAGAISALPFAAQAATIAVDSAAPVGPFIALQSGTASSGSDSFRTRQETGGNWTGRDAGQMFTPAASSVMDSFTLRVAAVNGAIAGENITIRFGTITDGGGTSITFNQLFQEQVNLPAVLAINDYLTFDVQDTSLSAGQKYGWLVGLTNTQQVFRELGFARTSVNHQNGLFIETFDVASDGTTSNLAWLRPGRDLQFWVSPVPEPSLIGLAGLGAIGLLRRRARA